MEIYYKYTWDVIRNYHEFCDDLFDSDRCSKVCKFAPHYTCRMKTHDKQPRFRFGVNMSILDEQLNTGIRNDQPRFVFLLRKLIESELVYRHVLCSIVHTRIHTQTRTIGSPTPREILCPQHLLKTERIGWEMFGVHLTPTSTPINMKNVPRKFRIQKIS